MIVPAYKTLRNIHFTIKFEKKNSPDCQLDRTGRILARLEPSICGDVGTSITRDVSVELNILLNCKLGSNLNLTCCVQIGPFQGYSLGSLFD